MITYRAIYQTNHGTYAAFVDAPTKQKAERFFAAWQQRLSKDGFRCDLVETKSFKPSFSFHPSGPEDL